MKKALKLFEANLKTPPESSREKKVKNEIIKLLLDDGQGHHHATYAKLLSLYTFRIVPLKDHPIYTAATSYETGTIYIGEGFLVFDKYGVPPETKKMYIREVSTLIRHEIAHNLLQHEIRMIKELKKHNKNWKRINSSASLRDLENIITDYEISNTRYTESDKDTVRNLFVCGQILPCLVTEDDRQDWSKMSLEDMYNALVAEIKQEQSYARDLIINGNQKDKTKDPIAGTVMAATSTYRDWEPGIIEFNIPLDQVLNILKSDYSFSDEVKAIAKEMYQTFVLDGNLADIPDTELDKMHQQIADSDVWDEVDLVSPTNGKVLVNLVTPEEKAMAQRILKNLRMFRNEYTEWYYKVLQLLSDPMQYSNADIKKVFDALKN